MKAERCNNNETAEDANSESTALTRPDLEGSVLARDGEGMRRLYSPMDE